MRNRKERAMQIFNKLTEEEKGMVYSLKLNVDSNDGVIINYLGEFSYTHTDEELIQERFHETIPEFFTDQGFLYEPLFSVYFRIKSLENGVSFILKKDNIYGSLELYDDEDFSPIKDNENALQVVRNLMYYLD
jgi:hypothetical protein